MSLSNEQKAKITANIKTLDYLEGTGVISTNRKKLVNEPMLFISVGGNARKVLLKHKKTVYSQVDHDEIKKKMMFLSIDTAHLELDECVARGELEPDEILKIPFEGAHASIKPGKMLPQMEEWVHKDLWAVTGGDNLVSKEFNGTGAGGRRQCGRVLFCQSAVQEKLYRKLSAISGRLAELQNISMVKVFFLCGISGGTGSGTIIDLAYLTRYFLNNILGTAAEKVIYSAYLFMPSACSDSSTLLPGEEENGKRNAYAALKEIDYYMTIAERKEHFRVLRERKY